MARRDITTNGGHVEWRKWWKLVNSGRDRTRRRDATQPNEPENVSTVWREHFILAQEDFFVDCGSAKNDSGTSFRTRIKEGINILTLWLSIAVIVLFIPVWCFLCDDARPPTSIVGIGPNGSSISSRGGRWFFFELNEINFAFFIIMWFASQTFCFVVVWYSNLRSGKCCLRWKEKLPFSRLPICDNVRMPRLLPTRANKDYLPSRFKDGTFGSSLLRRTN